MQAAPLPSPKPLQMSAMKAIAAVRANTKANAKPTKMRLTPKAKAASDDCADLAAYRKEGDPPKVRRSTLEARKKALSDKRMHHKRSVTIPDYEVWLDEAEEEDYI